VPDATGRGGELPQDAARPVSGEELPHHQALEAVALLPSAHEKGVSRTVAHITIAALA
jgi:hypothetical protein